MAKKPVDVQDKLTLMNVAGGGGREAVPESSREGFGLV
jgi:hypothetical protein